MAGDKRELILDLLARDKSGPATKAFAKNLDDAGKSAEKAGDQAKKFGKDSELAARGADKLGDESRDVASDLAKLDREIAITTAELGHLARAFARTDDAAERLDISKAIRKGENDIRRMSKSGGLLKALLPDPSPAEVGKWTTKLTSAISSGLTSSPPIAIAAGVLGAALAPTLGAAIAGGVVGGIGIGGIVGGFALAAKDPAIAGYAKSIGKSFSTSVQAEAKDAFGGPMKDSLSALEALSQRSAGKIGKIFDNTAPSVGKFTDAIVGTADALLDAAVVVSSKAGPSIDALGRLVQTVGQGAGDFLEMLATHSEEGASALDDLGTAITGVLGVVSGIVDATATVKGWSDSLDDAIDKSRSWLEDQSGIIDLTADGYKKGSEAAELYRKGVIGAAGAVNDYNAYLKGAAERTNALAKEHDNAARAAAGQRNALDELAKEMQAQVDPVFGLLNAEDKLAEAQKKAKDAAHEHGKGSRESRIALRELAEAAINMQGKAGALADSFKGKMTPELMNTLRAAGLTKGQIARLGDEFSRAKTDGDRFARRYQASVGVSNAASVRKSLYGVRDAANSIPEAVTVAIRITGDSSVSKAANSIRKQYEGRATGGPMAKDIPYWTGENGPELIIPDSNSRVLSAAASRGAVRQHQPAIGGRGGLGGGGGIVRLEVVGQAEVVTMIRSLIRNANLLQDA